MNSGVIREALDKLITMRAEYNADHPIGEQVDKTLSELTEEDLSANDE